jgi:hypothetical protein
LFEILTCGEGIYPRRAAQRPPSWADRFD